MAYGHSDEFARDAECIAPARVLLGRQDALDPGMGVVA